MSKPLTPNQRQALGWMRKKALHYTVAGFACELQPGKYWSSGTVISLEARGLCTIAGNGMTRCARINKAGRRELGGVIAGKKGRR